MLFLLITWGWRALRSRHLVFISFPFYSFFTLAINWYCVKKINPNLHKQQDEGIPIYENYLLFIASYRYPDEYLKYEFVDYRKAIERGIGLCSQQAIIVSEILNSFRLRRTIYPILQYPLQAVSSTSRRPRPIFLIFQYSTIPIGAKPHRRFL